MKINQSTIKLAMQMLKTVLFSVITTTLLHFLCIKQTNGVYTYNTYNFNMLC